MVKGLKTVVVLLALAMCSTSSFAQSKTVYVMKDGKVAFKTTVSGVDSVISYNPLSPVMMSSQDALFIYKTNASTAEKTSLDDVRKLTFSSDKMSVVMWKTASPQQYDIAGIAKLTFKDAQTGINYPVRDCIDVLAYFSPDEGLVIESPAIIKSLTLFGIDGKIISAASMETLRATSPQWNPPAGVYLVRVETIQGTVVKKLLKH